MGEQVLNLHDFGWWVMVHRTPMHKVGTYESDVPVVVPG